MNGRSSCIFIHVNLNLYNKEWIALPLILSSNQVLKAFYLLGNKRVCNLRKSIQNENNDSLIFTFNCLKKFRDTTYHMCCIIMNGWILMNAFHQESSKLNNTIKSSFAYISKLFLTLLKHWTNKMIFLCLPLIFDKCVIISTLFIDLSRNSILLWVDSFNAINMCNLIPYFLESQ